MRDRRCGLFGALGLICLGSCRSDLPIFPPEYIGDNVGAFVLFERDPSSLLEVHARAIGDDPIEFELAEDVQRVWVRLHHAPLELYLESLGPQPLLSQGRALPRPDASYALDLLAADLEWQSAPASARIEEVRVARPPACAELERISESRLLVPEEVVTSFGWKPDAVRRHVLLGRSGRRWALDAANELVEIEAVPRVAEVSASAAFLGIGRHSSGVAYFMEEGGITLETQAGVETFHFPHGEIIALSYASGISERLLLVLNDRGELYLHSIGVSDWEKLHQLEWTPGPGARLELGGERLNFCVLDPATRRAVLGNRSSLTVTNLVLEGVPRFLFRHSGIFRVLSDRGEAFVNRADLHFTLEFDAHLEGSVTDLSVADPAMDPSVPWQFGYQDGRMSERLPNGALCPFSAERSGPIAYMARLPAEEVGTTSERLVVIDRQDERGEVTAAVFDLVRP